MCSLGWSRRRRLRCLSQTKLTRSDESEQSQIHLRVQQPTPLACHTNLCLSSHWCWRWCRWQWRNHRSLCPLMHTRCRSLSCHSESPAGDVGVGACELTGVCWCTVSADILPQPCAATRLASPCPALSVTGVTRSTVVGGAFAASAFAGAEPRAAASLRALSSAGHNALSSTARFGDGVFGIGLTAFPTEPRGAAGPSGISASSLVLFCGVTGLAAAFFEA